MYKQIFVIYVLQDVPFVNTELLMNKVQRQFLDEDPMMLDLSSANQVGFETLIFAAETATRKSI